MLKIGYLWIVVQVQEGHHCFKSNFIENFIGKKTYMKTLDWFGPLMFVDAKVFMIPWLRLV